MMQNPPLSAPMRFTIVTVSLGILCLALSAPAQTNVATKPISLQEAIRLALENNYIIAIERYNPRIASFNLGASYAYYDPVFAMSAIHAEQTTEGAFDPQTGLQLAGQETEVDVINGREPLLSGRLFPTGLRYDLTAEFQHTTRNTFRETAFFDRPPGDPRGDSAIRGFEESESYANEFSISLEQPLLRDFWIDRERANMKLLRKDIQISEYRLLYTAMDVVRQVQEAYYNLIGARETVKARQKGVELAERLVAENRKRIEVGTMAPLDEKQAESEAALRRAELIASQRSAIEWENRLKNLISSQYQQWHGVTFVPTEALLAIPQTYDIQESWLSALNLRPDFHEVKTLLERQDIELRYRYNQLFPYLSLVGTYGRRGFDELLYTNQVQVLPDGTRVNRRARAQSASFSRSLNDIREEEAPFYSVGAVLRFPLTFRAERNNYRAAKAEHEQAKALVQQLHQNILVGIDDAVTAARSAYELVQATRAASEFAEAAMEAEQKKLDNGRSTSFNVLQLQEDFTDRRALEIQALASYNTTLSMLYFLEGRILEKNGVKVELDK